MSQSFGLTLLALAFSITYVSACSWCATWSNEKKFCNDDFAILFRIVDNITTVGLDRVFEVELLKRYKAIQLSNLVEEELYSPADVPVECEVILIPDAYYVVSGNYIELPDQPIRMVTRRCSLQLYFASDPKNTYIPPECDKPMSQYADVQL